jgi:3-hydroxyacyl-CoA dehydrogenase
MGRSIIQVLAQCGARVLLYDAKAGAGRQGSRSGNRWPSWWKRGGVKQKDADATFTSAKLRDRRRAQSLRALPPAVVRGDKCRSAGGQARVLPPLAEAIVLEDCIIASNTSSLSVTATWRPG